MIHGISGKGVSLHFLYVLSLMMHSFIVLH